MARLAQLLAPAFVLLVGVPGGARAARIEAGAAALALGEEEEEEPASSPPPSAPARRRVPELLQPAEVASSLAERLESNASDVCDGHHWVMKSSVESGNFGSVSKARKLRANGNEIREDFAMKIAKEATLAWSIDVEIAAMKKVKECQGIVRLEDSEVCLQDSVAKAWKRKRHAFTMQLIEGNIGSRTLTSWAGSASADAIIKCRDKIEHSIRTQLHCAHQAGIMHGDLKADNIFITEHSLASGKKCPKSVHLADFGLSAQIGKGTVTFPADNLVGSHHLPSSIFDSGARLLGLHYKQVEGRDGTLSTLWKADPVVDWCSFMAMMRKKFLWDVPEYRIEAKGATASLRPKIAKSLVDAGLIKTGTNCGMMGRGRMLSVRHIPDDPEEDISAFT